MQSSIKVVVAAVTKSHGVLAECWLSCNRGDGRSIEILYMRPVSGKRKRKKLNVTY